MKFSDLVVLGSTIISLESTVYLKDGCGCLIGMAAAARTGAMTATSPDQVLGLFPWLQERNPTSCPVCGKDYSTYSGSISCVAFHLEQNQWDFEQALSYIRMIEPKEEIVEDSVAVEHVIA